MCVCVRAYVCVRCVRGETLLRDQRWHLPSATMQPSFEPAGRERYLGPSQEESMSLLLSLRACSARSPQRTRRRRRPEARDWATSESGKPYFWYGVMVNKDQAESQTKKQVKAQVLFKFPRSKLGKGKQRTRGLRLRGRSCLVLLGATTRYVLLSPSQSTHPTTSWLLGRLEKTERTEHNGNVVVLRTISMPRHSALRRREGT